MNKTLLQVARNQESLLLKTRDRLLSRNQNVSENKTFQYERAKLIGMVDMLNSVKINTLEFSWIYNY